MSLVASWSPFFQSSVRMEGRALQLAGKVRRVDPEDGELVRAVVDADDASYTVTIARDEGSAVIQCDSPEFESGSFDKCVWATVLLLQHEQNSRDGDEDDRDHENNGQGDAAATGVAQAVDVDQLAELRLKPPKARKRAASGSGESAVRTAREPDWVGRLSLLRPATLEAADSGDAEGPRDVLPVQRQVCYVIRPDLCRKHAGLVIELQHRTALASGWSKPKRLRLSAETIRELPDPADRELCGMVVGSSWVSEESVGGLGGGSRGDRGHATYRLPVGSRTSLLKKMIATGRCHLANEEGEATAQAVKWGGDRPWMLWLVGSESDDGRELILTLEVRRQGRRIGIEQPAVLLGGRDGLMVHDHAAAPLDDRDAFRWVGQFRDDLHGEIEAKPIRVPMSDTPRLLERLYMLPMLPELDLPEGMGRAERRVEPTPHLDLFAAGSPEAGRAQAGKGQLAAQVWFAYGSQRVDAGAPGRFVAMPGEETQTQTPTAGVDEGHQDNRSGGETPNGDAAHGSEEQGDSQPPAQPAPASLEPHAGGAQGAAEEARRLAESGGFDPLVVPESQRTEDGGVLVRREHRTEREAVELLATLGFRQPGQATGNHLVLAAREMPRVVGELIARGWVVSADRAVVRTGAAPKLSVTSGVDWFELRGTVAFQRADGSTQDVPLPEILAAAKNGRQMITLDDGTQGLVPEQWLESHQMLTAMGKIEGDHLRFARPQAALLDALLDQQELERADDGFIQTRERLARFNGVAPVDPPERFHGSLRPYQRFGLGWMGMLRHLGMGGVLADDMGLGKTVQVLGALLARREQSRGSGAGSRGPESEAVAADSESQAPESQAPEFQAAEPGTRDPETGLPSIIVVPRSVVFNWIDEAGKFTPELRVAAYTGPDRAEVRQRLGELDVIVTSYGLLRRDIEELRRQRFDYVVLDEAQAIKNPQSQAAKACRLLEADHRLALTGTPIENHLGDLWSIFEFLNPGMLGSGSKFSELVRSANAAANAGRLDAAAEPAPDPSHGDGRGDAASTAAAGDASDPLDAAEASQPSAQPLGPIAQVAKAVQPFILRRTKSQVLDDLPAKTEQTVICEMSDDQRKIYDDLRDYYRASLLNKVEAADGDAGKLSLGGGSAFMVLEALLRLRQAACHPGLINDAHAAASSAKLEALEGMLDDVIEEDGKALVFSQFTSMLGLVRQRLDARGIRYAYLDGQTRNRKQIVESFQNDPDLRVFLISLKAGGLGLNLTAAEYVFLLDPWWNPAVEAQAIDRTHRIGQTKPVFAYRMICEDTVEQRVLELQKAKRDLADAVVSADENVLRSLTKGDLERLLS